MGSLLTFALTVAGCNKPEPLAPKAALDSYAAALREGRADRAYSMLSDEAKRDLPFGAFEQMLRDNPAEAQQLAAQLSSVSAPVRVTATVTAADGEVLLMVMEDGQWRVDGSVVELYGQQTPRQALESFVRALDRGRYDVLLRFVPKGKRGDLTAADLKKAWEGEQSEEIRALTEVLRASLPTVRIEVVGDRATVAFGAGGAVELIREQGIWKVEDVIR